MRVCRDGGDAGHAKVETWNLIPEPLAPREDEAAQTAVHVQPDVVLYRDLGKLLDRVDQPMRVVGGRADESHGVLGDVGADPIHVGEPVVAEWRLQELDPQHVGRLLKGDMRRHRHDDLGFSDSFLGTAAIAVHEHRIDQALGAAERHDAARLLTGVMLRHRVAVEHGCCH